MIFRIKKPIIHIIGGVVVKNLPGLFVLILGLTGGCSAPNELVVSTGCETGFELVGKDDVPTEIINQSSVSGSGYYFYYKSARLDGVCLDAMTQNKDRTINISIRGKSPLESQGAISRLIFPGDRVFPVPTLRDPFCLEIEDDAVVYKKISAFTCRTFQFDQIDLLSSSGVGGINRGLWTLPWVNIDVLEPQYFYIVVSMPSSYENGQLPSDMSLFFDTVPTAKKNTTTTTNKKL